MAIPYSRQSWQDDSVGGTPLSATRLTVVEQGIYDGHLMPACRAYNSAGQSIASSTWTTLTLDSERFDTASGSNDIQHDNVTNTSRLTCRYAGIYQITASTVTFQVNSANFARQVLLRVNGTTTIAQESLQPPAATPAAMNVSTLWAFVGGEYVELQAWQDTGSPVTVASHELMWARVA